MQFKVFLIVSRKQQVLYVQNVFRDYVSMEALAQFLSFVSVENLERLVEAWCADPAKSAKRATRLINSMLQISAYLVAH